MVRANVFFSSCAIFKNQLLKIAFLLFFIFGFFALWPFQTCTHAFGSTTTMKTRNLFSSLLLSLSFSLSFSLSLSHTLSLTHSLSLFISLFPFPLLTPVKLFPKAPNSSTGPAQPKPRGVCETSKVELNFGFQHFLNCIFPEILKVQTKARNHQGAKYLFQTFPLQNEIFNTVQCCDCNVGQFLAKRLAISSKPMIYPRFLPEWL
jgi:hypothetical protein